MKSNKRITILRVLSLVFVLTITVLLVLSRDKVQQLEGYGYPGIFLFSLLANATLILPIPGVLVTSAMGAVFNPFWVAAASAAGAALGETTGYLTGFSGQAVIENRVWYDKVEGWMKKYGLIIIVLLAFIPNPLFDIAGIIAGSLRMPLWQYMLASLVGKFFKMLLFAYGGATILHWLGL
jgi:uncharacterized membrane protein YdjX (TVP38/TMEM64 family)